MGQQRPDVETELGGLRPRFQKPSQGSSASRRVSDRHLQFDGLLGPVLELEPMTGLADERQLESGRTRFLCFRLHEIGGQIDGSGRVLGSSIWREIQEDQDRSQKPTGVRHHHGASAEC